MFYLDMESYDLQLNWGDKVLFPLDCLEMTDRDKYIARYFFMGYPYKVITEFLDVRHGIRLSARQLKRFLEPRRKTQHIPLFDRVVRSLIQRELEGAGSLLGYRAMHLRLRRKYGVFASRSKVMILLRELDPFGSQLRKKRRLRRRKYHSKGPNFTWHCDGNDKLGFCIHGCIDGFSRRVLWLYVAVTNNNPALIAHYFVECVKKLNGTPCLLRCDLGTENSRLAFIQPFMRRSCNDVFAGMLSFRYGTSPLNQRIEAWWGQLRRWCLQWWMDLFQGLEEEGLYDPTSPIHVECLKFCFMHLVQKSLNEVKNEWNAHRIRPSCNQVEYQINCCLYLLLKVTEITSVLLT